MAQKRGLSKLRPEHLKLLFFGGGSGLLGPSGFFWVEGLGFRVWGLGFLGIYGSKGLRALAGFSGLAWL